MKATNLSFYYDVPEEGFSTFENLYACRKKYEKKKKADIEGIKLFVKMMFDAGYTDLELFDNFFFSFTINQISKEFDLIKISEDLERAVNIELKSQAIEIENVKKQLVKNKYYLTSACSHVDLYTVILDEKKVYKLTEDNEIVVSDLKSLTDDIVRVERPMTEGIEKVFSASQFIMSPISEPEKFLGGFYALNAKQEEVKSHIISIFNDREADSNLVGVEGQPGTGKSLLLYDIAQELAQVTKVLIIHCAIMSPEHKKLKIDNVDIVPVKGINASTDFTQYGLVLVDEAHRIYPSDYKIICQETEKNNIICVMFYDDMQRLQNSEISANISWHIKETTGSVYKLSEKVRSNPELGAFISLLFNLRNWNSNYDYDNVDILYASDKNNADVIKNYYVETKGYKFINFTSSNYSETPFDYYRHGCHYESTHRIIGMEFDKVVCIIDDNFFYNDERKLAANSHPYTNYLYDRMLYQNLTRAREKLCLIIMGNKDLFLTIIGMLEKKYSQ